MTTKGTSAARPTAPFAKGFCEILLKSLRGSFAIPVIEAAPSTLSPKAAARSRSLTLHEWSGCRPHSQRSCPGVNQLDDVRPGRLNRTFHFRNSIGRIHGAQHAPHWINHNEGVRRLAVTLCKHRESKCVRGYGYGL